MTVLLKITYYEPSGRGRWQPFWANFIDHVRSLVGPNDDVGYSLAFNQELDRYNSRPSSQEDHTLEFSSEADRTLFLLRFS